MSFSISDSDIDRTALRKHLLNRSCGAFVSFEGWIRDHNDGREVLRLEYEVYRPLAVSEGERILAEALQRFEIADAACIHREGLLELGDTAVIAAAVAAHRDEAFKACRYIIDEVKHRLPIWKREHYGNGEAHWVNCQKTVEDAKAQS
ncbi:MAG: molybdenum cofactor biosynthesis protein MoaE [Xanthomonadales bacterium]|nr:molybdenum cofactor biosynthesis protein MoaE [Xanthomonadales bacterium]NNL94075.1 molybdenum cofactor biosynthesis protein MoaE [Xanthomonadales bacterium]